MKKKIFIFLISFVINHYYLPKYKSIRTTSKSGIVYLKFTDINLNRKKYFQMKSHNSKVNSRIYYDFSDDENFLSPSSSMDPATTWTTKKTVNEEVVSFSYKYDYEIVKKVSKK